MAITDDVGDVVRDYTYDVYGQVTGGSGSTPNEFDFAGQQSDDSTGLQYLRARYYDPATGVFISRDPLAAGPGWLGNPHGCVDGNPTNLVDPLGLDGWGGWDPSPCRLRVISKYCGKGEQVVDSVGGGAIKLVKLNGEYAIRVGNNVNTWLKENADVVQFVIGQVLNAAVAACLATGFGVEGGPIGVGACAAAGTAWVLYSAWYVSGGENDLEKLARNQPDSSVWKGTIDRQSDLRRNQFGARLVARFSGMRKTMPSQPRVVTLDGLGPLSRPRVFRAYAMFFIGVLLCGYVILIVSGAWVVAVVSLVGVGSLLRGIRRVRARVLPREATVDGPNALGGGIIGALASLAYFTVSDGLELSLVAKVVAAAVASTVGLTSAVVIGERRSLRHPLRSPLAVTALHSNDAPSSRNQAPPSKGW